MRKVAVTAVLLLSVAGAGALLFVRWHQLREQEAVDRQAWMAAEKADTVLSPEFLEDAWIVLLPVKREYNGDRPSPQQMVQTHAEVLGLTHEIRTRGDSLLWSEISNYSLAKRLQESPGTMGSPLTMRDPDACLAAIMGAMRSKVLSAGLPDCYRIGLQ